MDDSKDLQARQAEWQRRQTRIRRARDLGLVVLAIGVLVLVYAALLAQGR